MRRALLSIALAAALAATAWNLYLWWTEAPPERTGIARLAAPSPPAGAPTAAEQPTRPPDVPALDQSDAWVRGLAEQLCAHPQAASWLATDRLVRRFVVVVDNVAEGVDPKKQLPSSLEPTRKFAAIERGGRLIADPSNAARYDAAAGAVAALDGKGCAELFRRVKPLVADAYRDLGYPDRRFDDTLAKAVRRLLDTPVPDGDVELERMGDRFQFRDPRLRELSPAQKELVRLGAANERRVQDKLREIARELELPIGPG